MQILGIRFCAVSDDAEPLAKMFDGLGLERIYYLMGPSGLQMSFQSRLK